MQDTPPSDSISRVVLLTGAAEAPFLSDFLRAHNSGLEVTAAATAEDLAAACAALDEGARLLSFCSPVIVPAAVLDAFAGPSYNFHPGPPNRPGRYPSVFALYDDARHFGITVHEMLPKVNSGAIVLAEWFEVSDHCTLESLEEQTFLHLATAFRRLSPHLACRRKPLPRQSMTWHGRKTTKADYEVLRVITPDMDGAEAARRRRACGAYATTL